MGKQSIEPLKRNLQLPRAVDALLVAEKETGVSITQTLSTAVYWYFNRLDTNGRELARIECAEWLQTGALPQDAIVTELERELRAAKARLVPPPFQQETDGRNT